MKTYRSKELYPRVGDSEYHYNVWYEIKNPECKYVPKEEDEILKNPFKTMGNFAYCAAKALSPVEKDKTIGYYARQPFNSVKLLFEGETPEGLWATEEERSKIKWSCRMFLDTLECGTECIASSYDKDEVHQRVAKMLKDAGAVLDTEQTREEIKEWTKKCETAMKHVDFLQSLLFGESMKEAKKEVGNTFEASERMSTDYDKRS